MISNSIIYDKTITLQVNDQIDVELKALSLDGFFVISIDTIQDRNYNDDVMIEILNEENYHLFVSNKRAIRAGATSARLKQPSYELFVKVYWGNIYFKPQLNKKYYLVLDNSHSGYKNKTIQVKLEWKSEITEDLTFIKTNLEHFKWPDLWQMYEKATEYGNQKDFVGVCDTLRTIIIILWTRVCEKLSNTTIKIPEGKSVDTKSLENILQENKIPEHIISFIRRTWSLVSELSHIEKTDGKEPTQNETRLALISSQSVISYLISTIKS